MAPKVTLLGARPYGKWVSIFGLFCSGGPQEPHLSTESLKVTLGAPKCLPKLSKIIEKLPQYHQHICKKNASMETSASLKSQNKRLAFRPVFHACLVLGFQAEYGYQLLVKHNFNKMACVPPCIPCFFGAGILARVPRSGHGGGICEATGYIQYIPESFTYI